MDWLAIAMVVLFENTASITFLDSPMFIDSGIIGGTIRTAKKYSGEMGFVISFREMKINSEAYQYCYLNVSEEYSFSQKNRLRIAYKDLRVEMPHSS
ncbi:MAG: hypothetical protein HC880_06685 [Bacteroidia bacterium]|nr:hypothetical protein [Bacteroidia bacterium]